MRFEILYKVVLMAAINAVALLGNTLVCISFYRNPRLRTKIDVVILALGITDLLSALILMPMSTASIALADENHKLLLPRWISKDNSDPLCYIHGFLMYLLSGCSLFFMALAALIRYMCILKPHIYRRYITKKTIAIILVSLVLSSVVVQASLLIPGYGKIIFIRSFGICMMQFPNHKVLEIVMERTVAIMFFGVPLISVFACYATIYNTVNKHNNHKTNQQTSTQRQKSKIKRRKRPRILGLLFLKKQNRTIKPQETKAVKTRKNMNKEEDEEKRRENIENSSPPKPRGPRIDPIDLKSVHSNKKSKETNIPRKLKETTQYLVSERPNCENTNLSRTIKLSTERENLREKDQGTNKLYFLHHNSCNQLSLHVEVTIPKKQSKNQENDKEKQEHAQQEILPEHGSPLPSKNHDRTQLPTCTSWRQTHEAKVTKTLLAILLGFACCWIPAGTIIAVIQNIDPEKHFSVFSALGIMVLYKVLLMVFINVVALFGNTLVCLSVYRNPRLRSKIGTVILTLAVTDLLTALTVMPLTNVLIAFTENNDTSWLDDNKMFCYLQGTLLYALTVISVCVMALTAFIRYLCVVKPNIYYSYITTKSIFTFVGAANLLIFVMEASVLIPGFAQVRFVPDFNLCMIFFLPQYELLRVAVLLVLAVSVIIPVLVSFGCYALILMTVRRHTRRIRTQISSMEKQQGDNQDINQQHPDANTGVSNALKRVSKGKTQAREEKVTKTLLAVFLAFICCWMPPIILAFAMETKHSYRDHGIVITFSVALSSAVNPLIYGATNRRFRKTYKKILTCKNI